MLEPFLAIVRLLEPKDAFASIKVTSLPTLGEAGSVTCHAAALVAIIN